MSVNAKQCYSFNKYKIWQHLGEMYSLTKQMISCRCAGCKKATICKRSRPVESFGCTLHSASLLACPYSLLLRSLHLLAYHCLMIPYLCLCPACLLAARSRLCAAGLCCSPRGDCPELLIRARHAPASAKTLSACPSHISTCTRLACACKHVHSFLYRRLRMPACACILYGRCRMQTCAFIPLWKGVPCFESWGLTCALAKPHGTVSG